MIQKFTLQNKIMFIVTLEIMYLHLKGCQCNLP